MRFVEKSGRSRLKRRSNGYLRSNNVTVCGHADQQCPVLPPGTTKLHWPLIDPANATGTEAEIMDAFKATCDEVEVRVRDLLAGMDLL